jgi:HEAT repeats
MFQLPALPRTLAAVRRDVTSERAEVRASAVRDAAKLAQGDAALASELGALLIERLADAAPQVRAAAALGLADMEHVDALPKLLVLVEDEHVAVRQMALTALGELGDRRALARVQRALADDRPDVRFQALLAFGRLEPELREQLAACVRASRDEDEAVRHVAFRLAEERLEDEPSRKGDAAVLEVSKKCMQDAEADVALCAVSYWLKSELRGDLGDSKTSGVARALLAELVSRGTVRGKKPSKEEESWAVELAGAVAWEGAQLDAVKLNLQRRAFGLRRYFGNTCTMNAKIALARLGDKAAEAAIISDLQGSNRELQSLAVVAAGRAGLTSARALVLGLKTRLGAELVDESLRLIAASEARAKTERK